MAPKKKSVADRMNLEGVPEKAREIFRAGGAGLLDCQALGRVMSVAQLTLFINNNDEDNSLDITQLKKSELLAEAIRMAVKLGEGEEGTLAAEDDEDLEKGKKKRCKVPQVASPPCFICQRRPPEFIFDACHCWGVCGNCRAERLWGTKKGVPYEAEDVLKNLRTNCPNCETYMFGRDIKRVTIVFE